MSAWWGRVSSFGRRLRIAWTSSMRLRVLAVTTVVGVAALALIGTYLSDRVRDALYDQRVTEALADAATRTGGVQAQFDGSTATTPAQVQGVADQILRAEQSAGASSIGALLRRSPIDAPSTAILDLSVGRIVEPSPALRAAVQENGAQQWQAVEVTLADGAGPGIIVGAPVALPEVGGTSSTSSTA